MDSEFDEILDENEELDDEMESEEFDEDLDEERMDLFNLPMEEEEEEEEIEKIELSTPVEEITIVDSMPEEVKAAVEKFNVRAAKMKNLMNTVKETREQEEAFANSISNTITDDEMVDDETIDDESEDDYDTDENVNNVNDTSDTLTEKDINDLEDFL